MYAQLRGRAVEVKLDRVVLDVNGVGYLIYATADTLARISLGEETTLQTHLVVREDALTLYGFHTHEERDIFILLIGISGVGPKLALAALEVFSPEQLRSLFASKDASALTRIPGVGKKTAQRLIVEVGDKLGRTNEATSDFSPVVTNVEVIQALEQLGWKTAQAQAAVSEAMQLQPAASVPQLLREALQILGRNHG